jgi:hypothetical protein
MEKYVRDYGELGSMGIAVISGVCGGCCGKSQVTCIIGVILLFNHFTLYNPGVAFFHSIPEPLGADIQRSQAAS